MDQKGWEKILLERIADSVESARIMGLEHLHDDFDRGYDNKTVLYRGEPLSTAELTRVNKAAKNVAKRLQGAADRIGG